MIKHILLIVLLLWLQQRSIAQNSKIDSLSSLIKFSKEDTNKVKMLNKLSWAVFRAGNIEKAEEHAQSAAQLAQTLEFKTGLAKALGYIAYYYNEKGDYPNAIVYSFKTLKVNEELKNSKGIVTQCTVIGNIYLYQNDYPQALTYYFKALRIHEELDNKGGIALVTGNIGIIYYKQKNYPQALAYYSRALQMSKAIGDSISIAGNTSNIGSIYIEQGNFTAGLPYYFEALKIGEALKQKAIIANNLGNIGLVYSKQKKYKPSEYYLQNALKYSKEIGDLESSKEVHQSLSGLYKQQELWKQSMGHYEQYIAIRDSLTNEENTKKTVRAEMNFDFEKKQTEQKLEQEKKDAITKTIIYSVSGILFLVVGFAVFAYYSYRQKHKANRIITAQKIEVEHQKHELEEKNKEILDSITYAKRIQQAILPPTDLIFSVLKDSFILYKPKDVVSGDFYGFVQRGDEVIITTADCTGHGVPGAFMSMIGSEQLTKIIIEKGITQPAIILDELHEGIRGALKQDVDTSESRDGMDIALYKVNLNAHTLEYAGANRPLWLISNGEIKHIKANKQAIGGLNMEYRTPFTNHQVEVKSGDILYTFTDGYADQFGGPYGKKFMVKNFERLLLEIQHLPMKQQGEILEATISDWKGSHEQVDDVLVIGVRI